MKTAQYPPTPELDKMKIVHAKSQAVGEFVDLFLANKGFSIGKPHVHDSTCPGWDHHRNKYNPNGDERCCYKSNEFVSCLTPLEKLLAEFFEIDLVKVENERREILEFLQP